MNYEIFSDSSSNLTDELIEKLGVNIVSLVYIADENEYTSYVKGIDSDLKGFYGMLREKKNVTTSAINQEAFQLAFEKVLKDGKDILYIGFSSGLSLTYQSAVNAISELKGQYPDRKMIAIDTFGASLGEGLMVYYACQKKSEGMDLMSVASYIEDLKFKVVHWFTVEDLYWLYKGGRVKKTAYLIASIAQIKPLMHMDNDGKLIPVGKTIGRKKSLLWLVERIVESVTKSGIDNQTIFISHGDCIDDVEFLKGKISEKIKVKDFIVNYVDPVVGAHSGPGTMAVFAIGEGR